MILCRRTLFVMALLFKDLNSLVEWIYRVETIIL